MTRISSIVIVALLALASVASAEEPAAPSADEVARRAVDIAGGAAWEKVRFVSFTFNVIRDGKVTSSFPQQWDRANDIYQISGRMPDGITFAAAVNLKTKTGNATYNGAQITDNATFQKVYGFAYAHFLNDVGFLLMPLRMFEGGVHRTWDGTRKDTCDHTWDLVKLTFDDVIGLPAHDTYWMWIDRETGLVDEWDFRTPTMKPEDPPMRIKLGDYRRVGNVLLSTRRNIVGPGQVLTFTDITLRSE